MVVNFWRFNKEENSTIRPVATPDSFDCVLIRGSGLVAPRIELNIGLTEAPNWNYAYIEDFGRYYYISEWYSDNNLWIGSLLCDVLATYRTEIGDADLYALRSSARYDGRIPDTLYPVKSGCSFVSNSITPIWNYSDTGYGLFILGVTCKDPDFGSVRYYGVPSNRMSLIIEYLLSDDLMNGNGFDPANASLELQKSIIDPLQFIKSCTLIPLLANSIYGVMSNSTDLEIFNWKMKDGSGNVLLAPHVLPNAPGLTFTRSVNIPKHPQTSARGNYVNCAPYTLLTLAIPPFGVIEIDTTVTSNATTLDLTIEIDLPTGLGILTVSCNGIILNRIEAQIGIPIQLSQVTRDFIGGVTSIINGVSGTIGAALSGNIGGAISSAATGIGSAVNSLAARSQSLGTGGSFVQLNTPPVLNAQFFEVVDDDINKNGRPLCQVVNCKDATGYYLVQDGDLPIPGTRDEASQIRSYLESGFYWE